MKTLKEAQARVDATEQGRWIDVPGTVFKSASDTLTLPKGVGIKIDGAHNAGTVDGFGSVYLTSEGFSLRATGGVHVFAYGDAHVRMESRGYCYAHGDVRVTACAGSNVFLLNGGATAIALHGSRVAAGRTSYVFAKLGSRVAAYDQAHVASAGGFVTTYQQATVRGRNLNPNPTPWPSENDFHRDSGSYDNTRGSVATWCKHFGIPIADDGTFYVYKGVGPDYCAESVMPDGTKLSYAPGTILEAPDWADSVECGAGLHFSPHPIGTLEYRTDAKRFLRCRVHVDETVTLGDKIKTKRILEPGCEEVDILGELLHAPLVPTV